MPRIAIVLLGLMFVVAAAPAARAQVTLHVAKIQVTGIHREALAADQASRDARAHNTLEHTAEDVAGAEPLVTRTRER